MQLILKNKRFISTIKRLIDDQDNPYVLSWIIYQNEILNTSIIY